MIHKSRICRRPPLFRRALALAALLAVSPAAHATRRSVSVLETSTSGRLVRLNAGQSAGLEPNAPVLFSAGDRKVAAGRVIKVEGGSAVVAVLEKYGAESPAVDFEYDLLYGEPFPEADNLPDYVADRDNETDNPGNERFFTPDGKELSPELDDDNYNPEVTLRPKLPEPATFSPHNITVGLGMFRNRVLPIVGQAAAPAGGSSYTTYQGWAARYAYTFRSHYWLRSDATALLSAEATLGIYNFNHTRPSATSPRGEPTHVRVIPVGFELRYLVEVNKLLKLYPYVGYLYNIVGASGDGGRANVGTDLKPLQGGRLLGGAGAQLLMSQATDVRVEGGSDGFLAGLVVKF